MRSCCAFGWLLLSLSSAGFRLLLFVVKVSLYFLLFSNGFSVVSFQFPICFVVTFFFAFFSLPVSLSPCLSPSSSLALTCFALLCLLILIQISVLLVLLRFPLFISLMWFSSFQFISLHSFFSFPFLFVSNDLSLVSFPFQSLFFHFFLLFFWCFALLFGFRFIPLLCIALHGFMVFSLCFGFLSSFLVCFSFRGFACILIVIFFSLNNFGWQFFFLLNFFESFALP